MEEKNKVEITVGNQHYTILSDEPTEKIEGLASQINDRLNELMADGRLSLTQALVLVALDLANNVSRQAELTDSTEIDESRLSPYVSVLTSRRADMIRGFAYIQKADLRRLLNPQDAVHSTIVAKPIEDTDSMIRSLNIPAIKKPLTRDYVLEQILKAKNFFELRDTMKTLIRQGAVSDYGKRETCRQPEACYWIVYDRAGNIKAILGKGQTIRKNFKTGRVDSLTNYQGKGYAGIWFQIKEQ